MVAGTEGCLTVNSAFLRLNLVGPRRLGPDTEGIVSCLSGRERKVETQRKMVRMAARPASHFLDGPAVAKCVVERTSQRVSHKSQRIQEIALAGSVGADQEH